MVLLVLAVLALAAVGDPVERGASVVFDQCNGKVRIHCRVAEHSNRAFELERTLLVPVLAHRHLR